MEQICGQIERILFSSDESGFTVAKVQLPNEADLLSIVGTMPSIQAGETILCKGIWKHHPKHGRQFVVETHSVETPQDEQGIEKYLASGAVKGIGPSFAKRIVAFFGDAAFQVLEESPRRLLEIPGIGVKKVEMIEASWNSQRSIRNLMMFLQSKGMRTHLAKRIYRVFGDASIEKIQENPYVLAQTVHGIGFQSADEIGEKLGIAKDSPARVAAGIEHALWELSQEGHTCYPRDGFIERVSGFLAVGGELIDAGIDTLELEGRVVVHPMDEQQFVWVKPLYMAEVGISRELSRLAEAPSLLRSIDATKALDWVESRMGIQLAKEQAEAIAMCCSEKMHILTGGPGTGKSTITNAILQITEKLTDQIVLAAPTGRAAKRMQEITRKRATTIHSLLEYDFTKGGFKRGKKNPLNCDMVVIDEASMIDTQLMYSFLKAVPDRARVLFIGDIDQLPSVGPGCVLKDLIASEKIPVTQLKQIFRQARGSKIVTNAHSINQGYFPDLDDTKGDFLFFEATEPEQIVEKLVPLVTTDLPGSFGFNPIMDIQVLTPMKRGVAGSENLNVVLQQALNPSSSPLERMGRHFHLGDKVMQIRNNYDKNVYNGDVGRIERIDTEEAELLVSFDGREIVYDFSDMDELMLAYAVSVHKYQGSECPCVIIPVHTSHFKLLFRNLLYTGITRGKKLVVLIGSKKAIAIACKNTDVLQRHTGLLELMRNV